MNLLSQTISLPPMSVCFAAAPFPGTAYHSRQCPHASANVISQALHTLSLSSYRITLCCKMNNHPGILEF